jgi:hypothetical protein
VKLHRRAHGAPLGRRQRKKVHAQTKTLVKQIQHGASGSSSRHETHSIKQLRQTLHGVRTDVLHDGAGRNTKLVASALSDLDRTLVTLSHSYTEKDLDTRMRLLADAAQALDRAEAKARKAGHDWPL